MLKITRAADPIRVSQLVVTIYSPPGLGKTTLGFTAESPLLLDFDGGAYRAANRKDSVQVTTWADIAGITAADLAEFKTVVVDTAGRALDCLSADIIARNPKMGRGGALTLQGYGELKSTFIGWTKLLRSFGLDVVLLAHSDEQRSGDDLIERLDMQGGSKNEVYKVSDAMGRLAIPVGQRSLNFSPTDTGFGKNPAQLGVLRVPDVAQDARFLAGVIQGIKDHLNTASVEQKAEAERMEKLAADLAGLETLDELNKTVTEMSTSSPKDKALLLSAGLKRGFDWDKKAKVFVSKTEVAA